MPGPDYILDLTHLKTNAAHAHAASSGVPATGLSVPTDAQSGLLGRPWLSIYWKCCKVYGRIYRNAAGDAYQGRCPHCGRQVSATVGPGGTSARFFTAE